MFDPTTPMYTFTSCLTDLGLGHILSRSKMYGFLAGNNNLDMVLARVFAGFEIPFVSANFLRTAIERHDQGPARGLYKNQLQKRWAVHNWFEDDSSYTNARFQLLAAMWDIDTVPMATLLAAQAQVLRLLRVGRVNVRQVDHLAYVGRKRGLPEIAMVINAHDDALYSPVAELSAVALAAVNMRGTLFVKRWLPALLGEHEYSSVRDLTPELLRGLYPAYWQHGYELYRRERSGELNGPANGL